jgi:DnaJ-class molecular chaperone
MCPKCNGKGWVPSIEVGKDFEPVQCKRCKGVGYIYGEAWTGPRHTEVLFPKDKK